MTPKERVVVEVGELSSKIDKLANALDANGYGNLAIPKEQINLLGAQPACNASLLVYFKSSFGNLARSMIYLLIAVACCIGAFVAIAFSTRE